MMTTGTMSWTLLFLTPLLIQPILAVPDYLENVALMLEQNFKGAAQETANWSNMSLVFDDFGDRSLISRQGCLNAGYVPCPNSQYCCPAGYTCTPNGCCPAGQQQCSSSYCYDPATRICCSDGSSCPKGTECNGNLACCPAGKKLCGSNGCYDPETEVCCSGGLCDKGYTCCQYKCCGSAASCQSNGNCSANTCVATTTQTSTRYIGTRIISITKIVEPEVEKEDGPEFICPPMTITNDASDTLELGDDCALTFYPAPSSTSTTPPPANAVRSPARPVPIPPALRPRDTKCVFTATSTYIYTVDAMRTITSTVTSHSVSETFSCIPMSVTDEAGDELSLDEKCKFEFTPGDNSTTTQSESNLATTLSGSAAHLGTSSATDLKITRVSTLSFILFVLYILTI